MVYNNKLFKAKDMYLMSCTPTGKLLEHESLSYHKRRMMEFNNMHLMDGMEFSDVNEFPLLKAYSGPVNFDFHERLFFETIREKMLTELAPCSELLLSEVSNTDEVYLLRTQYDEFIVGQGKGEFRKDEVHTMNLSEALNIDMKANGFLPDAISLFEWLRKIDYRGLQYNHNYAYL